MNSNWIDPKIWRQIQGLIPITCVDILPLRLLGGDYASLQSIGLIMRETPHQGQRWCLVGGRLHLNEGFQEAISREIREALGSDVQFKIDEGIQPDFVAEYFTFRKKHGGFDPRQHAIGLTFCIPIEGKIRPKGEAIAFEWFKPSRMPDPDQFGFNQDKVVSACLNRLGYR